MADTARCAHPACECMVPPKSEYGKFCSEHCKEAGQITELRCNCQHAECRRAGQGVVPPGRTVMSA